MKFTLSNYTVVTLGMGKYFLWIMWCHNKVIDSIYIQFIINQFLQYLHSYHDYS